MIFFKNIIFKKYIILFLLFFICFYLRFFNLGKIPIGFSMDEASLGYNAYSILKTGRDEFGISYPLAFKSFGEFKAPLYIYLSIPFIAIFGLNEFAVRLTSATFGFLTIIVLYFFTKTLFKDERIALISSFVLSIFPWHLQFSRIAYEGSITVFLLTFASLFFILGIEKKRYLFISSFLFVLTFYSHYAVRVFTPLYLLAIIFIYQKYLLKVKKEFLLSFLLGILLLIPLVPTLISDSGLVRGKFISFTTDKGIVFSINEKRAEHNWSNINLAVKELLHNKASEYTKKFLENYLAHFDFSFLFIKGDEDKLFKTPYTGLLLFFFLPFLLLGFLVLLKSEKKTKLVLFSWLFLAPIPSSLTRFQPSANRAFIMIVPITIIITLGLFSLFDYIKRHKNKIILFPLLIILMIEFFYYLDSYYVHMKIKNEGDNRLAEREIIKFVSELTDRYDQIWLTDRSSGYIHLLFYLKYPPEKYQKQAELSSINEFGFIRVINFDKYHFDRIPKYFDFSENTLYIGRPDEIPKVLLPLKKFYYQDGRLAFLVFDTEQLKKNCPVCNLENKPSNENIYGELIK